MTITVTGVSKRFGDSVALEDVSLCVPDGSLTALLGPSGGGKSTLLRVVAGLETPDSGAVLIDGTDVTRTPARLRGVGFCFQHYAPFRHMTVWRNVAFGLEVRRRPKPEIKARVTELLELVRLEGMADRYPSQLSGGQRQRMALARALAVEPKVLLLDEPFGALDAQVRKELRSWLRRLHEEVRVTTVLVTHDQEEAMEVADLLAVVNQGHLEQSGPPSQLYDHPVNEFVMTFVGPATRLAGTWVRPHDLVLHKSHEPGAYKAVVQDVAYLGFEVRIDARLDSGDRVWAQLPRNEALRLGIERGEAVWLSAGHSSLGAPGGTVPEAVSATDVAAIR